MNDMFDRYKSVGFDDEDALDEFLKDWKSAQFTETTSESLTAPLEHRPIKIKGIDE